MHRDMLYLCSQCCMYVYDHMIHPSCHMTTHIDIFKTDTEISRSNGPSFERELQPFTDFTDQPPSLDDEVIIKYIWLLFRRGITDNQFTQLARLGEQIY